MKFLLDQDVPEDLTYLLGELKHEVLRLRDVLPQEAADPAVLLNFNTISPLPRVNSTDDGQDGSSDSNEQDARRHGEQDQGIEDEGSDEPSPQVVGLADGGGVGEGMHPRLHVPGGRIAGYGRGHQKPDQAAKNSDDRDDEWRIEEVIAATRVG